MGDAFVLPISYDQLMLLLMGLFMFVGATRGWRQEAISTSVLLGLTAITAQPELAAKVVDYISRLIRMVLAFIGGLGNLDFGSLEDKYRAIKMPFDGENPYMLLIAVLVGFVFVSYNLRTSVKGVTALSRILGGLLGLFNSVLVISLFREYVLRYFQKASPALWAAAGATPEFSVAVRGMPTGGLLSEQRVRILMFLLVLMVAVLFISIVTKRPIGKR